MGRLAAALQHLRRRAQIRQDGIGILALAPVDKFILDHADHIGGHVIAAAARLAGHARVTPLLNAPLLDRIAGRRIFVKAECLQWTGSFKFRGGWSAVSALPPGTKGVMAYSSGNHAQGVALAAHHHGLECVILMPADAPAVKIANTRAYGAEVVLYDRATEDRDAIGENLAATRGLALVKPFDDAQVIAGQGTTGLEIAAQARALGIHEAAVIACCKI